MTEYQTPARMALKEKAIPLPDFDGLSVLDVGCDHGHWCWLAVERGASHVLGLDRNRKVSGTVVDIIRRNTIVAEEKRLPCRFEKVNIGQQWPDYGQFDVVFCFSMYHHIFANCEDHNSIWYWLWRRTGGLLLWENPTGPEDSVVRQHVSAPYERADIVKAAERYFEIEVIGEALHSPTREVWRCTPKKLQMVRRRGMVQKGAGGATKAFEYAGGRRIDEIEHILGVRMLPGSLNVRLGHPFAWDLDYYRSKLLDVENRPKGLDSPWAPRWARFYPVTLGDTEAFAFRFEGERYPDTFVELISSQKLSSLANDGEVQFWG